MDAHEISVRGAAHLRNGDAAAPHECGGEGASSDRSPIVESGLTDEQLSLYRTSFRIVWISVAHRQAFLGHLAVMQVEQPENFAAGYARLFDPPLAAKRGQEQVDALLQIPLAEDEPYRNWIIEPLYCPGENVGQRFRLTAQRISQQFMVAFMATAHEPHSCGGRKRVLGPLHYACTGCDTEVNLWGREDERAVRLSR